jgi:hypothetical protein
LRQPRRREDRRCGRSVRAWVGQPCRIIGWAIAPPAPKAGRGLVLTDYPPARQMDKTTGRPLHYSTALAGDSASVRRAIRSARFRRLQLGCEPGQALSTGEFR